MSAARSELAQFASLRRGPAAAAPSTKVDGARARVQSAGQREPKFAVNNPRPATTGGGPADGVAAISVGEERKRLLGSLVTGTALEISEVGECLLLERSARTRRGLLILLPNGSIEAVEDDRLVRVKRRAPAVGDRVIVPRTAMPGFPGLKWKDGTRLPETAWVDPAPQRQAHPASAHGSTSYGVIGICSGGQLGREKQVVAHSGEGPRLAHQQRGSGREDAQEVGPDNALRGRVTRLGVFVNARAVDAGLVTETIQNEFRKGQVAVELLADVALDTGPLLRSDQRSPAAAGTRSRSPGGTAALAEKCRPVRVAALVPVTEANMQRFRDAVRSAARSSVSAFSRAQVQAKALFDAVSLHTAAACGDVDGLAVALKRPGVSLSARNSDGRTPLGVCLCVCACIHTCTPTHAPTATHICLYIYTCIHTNIHTHTHTHTHTH